MKIEKPTIVTALFNIGRDTWDAYDLSYGMYLSWMKSLLMYDMPMVIYTDEILYEEIKRNRMVCDPNLEKTIFEIKTLDELTAHQIYHQKVNDLMTSDEFKLKIQFNVPEMTRPLYNIVIFNKIFYIKESIEKKHFDSDFYIWADAGVLRDGNDTPISNWPNLEKINNGYSDKITFFNHQDVVSVSDYHFHLMSQYRYIHGGCFFVPNNGTIDEFINDFLNYIDLFLEQGFVGSEEKYYDFCYSLKPHNYNIVKSDWRQYFNIFS